MGDQAIHALQIVDYVPGATGLVNAFFPETEAFHIIAWVDVIATQLGDVECDHVDVGQ